MLTLFDDIRVNFFRIGEIRSPTIQKFIGTIDDRFKMWQNFTSTKQETDRSCVTFVFSS